MRGIRWVYGAAALGTIVAGGLSEQACSSSSSVPVTPAMDAGHKTDTGGGGGGDDSSTDAGTPVFGPGDGGPCIGAVGSFPSPYCDPSDESACATSSAGCTYSPKCGDTTTCEPFTKNPAPADGTDVFRMRLLNVTAPPALASRAVQVSVVTAAVDLPDTPVGCGENGTGLFNWLISVDQKAGTITTGGAPKSSDPFGVGYCFVKGTIAGTGGATTTVGPVTSSAKFTGNTFTTPAFPTTLNVPIFLAPSGVVILPLSGASLEEVAVSADGNCIGSINVLGDQPQSTTSTTTCADTAPAGPGTCSRWHSAGALSGYITLAAADTVLVQSFNESLCVLLTDMGDGASPVQHCKTSALMTGDYMAPTKTKPGKASTAGDSYWLSAQFAASAVKLAPDSSNKDCQGGAISGG